MPPFTGRNSVWVKVLAMEDRIQVNYESLQQLFCQKTIKQADKTEEKKKAPKEVRTKTN